MLHVKTAVRKQKLNKCLSTRLENRNNKISGISMSYMYSLKTDAFVKNNKTQGTAQCGIM